MTFDVVCPGCKGRFHETTDKYTEETTPNGSMFQLKDPWKSWRWSSFPEQSHVTLGALECPGCGASYLVQGRVIIIEQNYGPVKKKELSPKKEKPVPKKKPLKEKMSTVDELF